MSSQSAAKRYLLLLTRPSTSGESNWELYACRWTSFKTLIVTLLCDWRSYGQLKWNWLCLFSIRCFISPNTKIFYGLTVSQVTLIRWGGISMAYLLSNNCTKNYWNRTTLWKYYSWSLGGIAQGTKVCQYNWHSAGSLGWPFPMIKCKYIFF